MRTINQIFYDNIGRICAERGMTISAFCNASGIPSSSLYRYGINKQTATLNTVERASEVLGIPIGELLEEDTE